MKTFAAIMLIFTCNGCYLFNCYRISDNKFVESAPELLKTFKEHERLCERQYEQLHLIPGNKSAPEDKLKAMIDCLGRAGYRLG